MNRPRPHVDEGSARSSALQAPFIGQAGTSSERSEEGPGGGCDSHPQFCTAAQWTIECTGGVRSERRNGVLLDREDAKGWRHPKRIEWRLDETLAKCEAGRPLSRSVLNPASARPVTMAGVRRDPLCSPRTAPRQRVRGRFARRGLGRMASLTPNEMRPATRTPMRDRDTEVAGEHFWHFTATGYAGRTANQSSRHLRLQW
jgi:hypothetical protein